VSVEDDIGGIIGEIKKLMRRVRNDEHLFEYQDWLEGILDSAIAVLSVAKGDK
jgi:hypothetical protein